jgi:hypothetical protein
MRARRLSVTDLPRAIAIAGTIMAVTACGSSSPTQATGTASAHTSVAAAREAAATEAAKEHRDTVTTGVVTHHPLHGTGGDEINDDNPGNADAGSDPAAGENDPCKLVSQARAQAILGRPIATPQVAPLGPTCIYQPTGAKTFVTLTLEGIKLAQLEPHIRHLTRFKLEGRTGYCGAYGQTTTFVPLASHKVLTITAPCDIGRLFAASALTRL